MGRDAVLLGMQFLKKRRKSSFAIEIQIPESLDAVSAGENLLTPVPLRSHSAEQP